MNKCSECDFENQKDVKVCEYCGASLVNETGIDSYVSKYKTSKLIMVLISFSGWIMVLLSSVYFLDYFFGDTSDITSMYLLIIAFGFLFVGFSSIVFAQISKAVVDSADHLGQILSIMKSRE